MVLAITPVGVFAEEVTEGQEETEYEADDTDDIDNIDEEERKEKFDDVEMYDEGGSEEPVSQKKIIYVSDKGDGDGSTEDNPTTLVAAIKMINEFEVGEDEEEPTFIISLIDNLKFKCDDRALTLKKYTTQILGNGHSIYTDRAITSDGEDNDDVLVILGSPDGDNELTLNVGVSSAPTLSVYKNATMKMYDGVTVHHAPEDDEDDSYRPHNSGGAVQVDSNSTFNMYGGEISNCLTAFGAILADNNSYINIYGGKICDNTTLKRGAVSLSNSSELVVDGNVKFENNESESRGGAVYVATNCKADISGKVVFDGNKSTLGGAIYAQDGNITVDGATFKGNSATSGGGAFLSLGWSNKPEVKILNCKFTDNYVTSDKGANGGAIYLQDSDTTLEDCIVKDNNATEVGGGIYFTGNSLEKAILTLNGNNIVEDNTVVREGASVDDNLYINRIEDTQLTLIVGEMTEDSSIGISLDSIEGIGEDDENNKPEAPEVSVPFTVKYKDNFGDKHPSSCFFSDNKGYHVDWSEDGNEARLVKGVPTYKVELDDNTLKFGVRKKGYKVAPDAKEVKITNTGNMPVKVTLPEIDGYTVTFGEDHEGDSVTLMPNESITFTVQPELGLKVGKYDKTVEIGVDNGEAPKLSVFFTVKRVKDDDAGGDGGHKPDPKPPVELEEKPDKGTELGLNTKDHYAYIVGYDNGEVRPQKSITRAEVAAIFFRLLEDDVRDANYTRANNFTDIATDSWYCSSVSTLSKMGIISGYPDGTFRPDALITRAEFAAIATRFDNNGDKTPVGFSDITGHWAEEEITIAANHGWVTGYGDGRFCPQNMITRAETMSLVNRVLNRIPETPADLLPDMQTWTDNADIDMWYYLAIQEATNSHHYELKENSNYEKWTEIRETRDWSKLG